MLVVVFTVGALSMGDNALAAWKFANNGTASFENKGPMQWIRTVSDEFGNVSGCDLTPIKLQALMLPVTWAEVTGRTADRTPHPMSVGRRDHRDQRTGNARLYFDNPSTGGRIYWHPGVGMWQLDDVDTLGSHLASGKWRPYRTIAKYMANTYCNAKTDPDPAKQLNNRLNAVYQKWSASTASSCAQGWCRDRFKALYSAGPPEALVNLQENPLTNYWGGGDAATSSDQVDHAGLQDRKCVMKVGRQKTQIPNCVYFDATKASPDAWGDFLIAPLEGCLVISAQCPEKRSPLSLPFYTFVAADGAGTRFEYRVWLSEDTGKPFDVTARRRWGEGSRSSANNVGLEWSQATSMCDITDSAHPRGTC